MQRIPEAARVTMRALPIALWCSDYRGTVEGEPAKPLFAPVRGAYVACIRIASGWRGSVSELWRLRCGRTNDFGWVIQRERGALGDEQDVPRSGWRRADLPPGGVAQRVDSEPSAPLDWEDAGVGQPTSLEMFTEDAPVTIAFDASDAYADALHVLPNETYRIHFEKKHREEEAGMQGVAIDGKLYLDLVQETLAAAGPSTELLAIARDRAAPPSRSDWLVRGGKRFAAAGLALESLRNVVSGATTLATLLPDAAREHLGASTTTDLERYLRDGETFAALVETAKGAVQVGSGTAGLCVVGGLTTLAGVALSQVVAVGLVAIAMADVVIYVDTGGASPVQNFKDGVFAARLRQFRAGNRPIDPAGGPSLLARQLGSLNALAKVLRAGS